MKKLLSSLPLFGLLFSPALFAIVNMEELHTGTPQEGFSGSVEGSYKSKSGNSERVDYALGTRLQWHHGAQTTFLLLSGEYGKVAGVENTRKAFSHLRHIRQLTPLLAGELFLQQEFDDFTRLESRRLAGAGARFTLYEREQGAELYFGSGLFREYERIDSSYPDGGTKEHNRGNLYLVLKFPLSDTASVVSSTYYQPLMAASADYRLLEQAALRMKLNDSLAVVIAIDHRRNSRPPLGLGPRDTSLTTSLAVSF